MLKNFKNESDNLERRLHHDLKTLSEIEKTTASMREYVTNGEMYDDTIVPSTLTVGECLKVKRSRDKQRSLSFANPDNDDDEKYDNYQSTASDFIGENVFLTAEPFEETEIAQPEAHSKYVNSPPGIVWRPHFSPHFSPFFLFALSLLLFSVKRLLVETFIWIHSNGHYLDCVKWERERLFLSLVRLSSP